MPDVARALDVTTKFLGMFESESATTDTKTGGATDVRLSEDGRTIRDISTTNFDGTECKTIGELATANGLTETGAATAVLTTKGFDTAMFRKANKYLTKELHAGPPSNEDGVAVVFTFNNATKKQLAMVGGEDYDDLHITVGFFGDASQFHSDKGLRIACMMVANELRPFRVQMNGITRFSGQGEDALVVNADSPILTHAYRMLHDFARDQGISTASEHGYTPHMTLGYLDPTDQHPLSRWTPLEISVDAIELWFGKARHGFALGPDYTSAIDTALATESENEPSIPPHQSISADDEQKDVYTGDGSVPRRARRAKRRELLQRAKGFLK